MAQTARTFRVFVSSTFSDLAAERNALQTHVFPRLRELAMTHGCRFQTIDLRWGVSEEAALDQQTMKICLGEIERCQKVSPRPNFIVLLGNRYGWRPLPYEIPVDEYERIFPLVPEAYRALIEEWYRQDNNALPKPVYVLQQRAGMYKKYETWVPVERCLHTLLEAAARQANLAEASLVKFTTSATEQEIIQGAFNVVKRKHIFCFAREVEGLPQDDHSQGFIDLVENKPDNQAARRLSDLKQRLKDVLGENYHEYAVRWEENNPSLEHLDRLCEDVYRKLEQVILQEMAALEQVDPLDKEVAAHRAFGHERARQFLGRSAILKQMDGYLLSQNHRPLAVFGPSGSGKSALMARAAQEAQKIPPRGNILQRFIGVTPDSSSGRAMLESLCRQITRLYKGDESTLPSSYKELVSEFPQCLKLATEVSPLMVFLDALDQLSDDDHARDLGWLPAELPPHVRLVVTTLPGECLGALSRKIPHENILELPSMPVEEGAALLDRWLDEAGRTLQPDQRLDILEKYAHCGLPLYLKLAFEEARHWRSYAGLPVGADAIPGLGEDIPRILRDLFWRLSQESNHGALLVERSLGYLAAAKNGLSEDEILDVLSDDAEVLQDFRRRSPKSPEVHRLPAVIWSRLFFDLEPYLVERTADGTSLLAFYHPTTFGKAVSEMYLAGNREIERHRKLAAYFNAQPLYLKQEEIAPNLRKLSEMVYQQARARLATQVAGTLLDYSYLKAKLTGQGVQSLLEEYALAGIEAEQSETLSLVQGALRMSAHVLARDTSQLPSQLTGRLLGFDKSDIKSLLEQAHQETKGIWLRPLTASLSHPGGPLVQTMNNQSSGNFVAVTPDGKRVISRSWDAPIRVLDLESGVELTTYCGHTGAVTGVALASDGKRMVSCSSDKTLKIWNMESGMELATLDGHTEEVVAVAITPDGKRVISGSWDKTLKVWDLESGVELATLSGHSEWVSAIAVTPDGKRVISGSWDTTLKVWDLESGEELITLNGHKKPVLAVAVTQDGKQVVSASSDRTMKVWDLESGADLDTLYGHEAAVNAIVLTPDGKHAISGSSDTTVRVWDITTGSNKYRPGLSELATLSGHSGEVKALALIPGFDRVVSASDDNTIKVWDLLPVFTAGSTYRTDQFIRAGHKYPISALQVTPDGQRVVSGSGDFKVKVWDLEMGNELLTLDSHNGSVDTLAVTPDGRRVISGSTDLTLKLWDMQSALAFTLSGHTKSINVVAVTPDGKQAVSGSVDGTLKVWDLEKKRELSTLYAHLDQVKAMALTPDGCKVVSAGPRDKTVKVWYLKSGAELATLHGHSSNSLAITPDGKRILSGGDNGISDAGILKVWDMESGAELATLSGHGHSIYALAVTPDGRFAITGSMDRTLKIWDLENYVERVTLNGHGGSILAVLVTPDGRRAVSASSDNALKVWDMETGKELASFIDENPLRVCSISPEGTTIVVGGDSCQVHFLRLEGITSGSLVVTAWRGTASGWLIKRKPSLAFGCPHCRTWSEIPESVLGNELPCPHCSKIVRLNPFVIDADWRPVANAWAGK